MTDDFIKKIEAAEKEVFSLKSKSLNSKSVVKANEIINKLQQSQKESSNDKPKG